MRIGDSADSLFVHLGGDRESSACKDCCAAVVAQGTTVSLKSCTFQSPVNMPNPLYLLAQENEELEGTFPLDLGRFRFFKI